MAMTQIECDKIGNLIRGLWPESRAVTSVRLGEFVTRVSRGGIGVDSILRTIKSFYERDRDGPFPGFGAMYDAARSAGCDRRLTEFECLVAGLRKANPSACRGLDDGSIFEAWLVHSIRGPIVMDVAGKLRHDEDGRRARLAEEAVARERRYYVDEYTRRNIAAPDCLCGAPKQLSGNGGGYVPPEQFRLRGDA